MNIFSLVAEHETLFTRQKRFQSVSHCTYGNNDVDEIKTNKKKHKYRSKYMVPSHTFQYGQSDEQINKAQIIKIYKISNAFNASENKKKTLFDL